MSCAFDGPTLVTATSAGAPKRRSASESGGAERAFVGARGIDARYLSERRRGRKKLSINHRRRQSRRVVQLSEGGAASRGELRQTPAVLDFDRLCP